MSTGPNYTQIYSGSYAPPEQRLGHDQGEFSDIYAIGAVCYRAIGGEVVDALVRHNALVAGKADPQSSAAQIGAERYPKRLLALIDAALATDTAQRPQTADAMLAVLVRDEPVEALTVVTASRARSSQVARGPLPYRPRSVWFGAAAAGVLALAGLASLMLLIPAAAPPFAIHQRVTASSQGAAAVAPQDRLPGPQLQLSDDTARQSTEEGGPPESSTASKFDQTPPTEQSLREATVVRPPVTLPEQTSSLQQIAGEAGRVSADGYLIVDDKIVYLSGVAGILADKASNVTSWIRSHGGHLECQLADGSTYRCLVAAQKRDVGQPQQPGVGQAQKIDVAQTLLLNGVAHITPDAAPLYRNAEAEARAAKRGLWR